MMASLIARLHLGDRFEIARAEPGATNSCSGLVQPGTEGLASSTIREVKVMG